MNLFSASLLGVQTNYSVLRVRRAVGEFERWLDDDVHLSATFCDDEPDSPGKSCFFDDFKYESGNVDRERSLLPPSEEGGRLSLRIDLECDSDEGERVTPSKEEGRVSSEEGGRASVHVTRVGLAERRGGLDERPVKTAQDNAFATRCSPLASRRRMWASCTCRSTCLYAAIFSLSRFWNVNLGIFMDTRALSWSSLIVLISCASFIRALRIKSCFACASAIFCRRALCCDSVS